MRIRVTKKNKEVLSICFLSFAVLPGVRAEIPTYGLEADEDIRLKKRLEKTMEDNISENYFKPVDKANLLNRYKGDRTKSGSKWFKMIFAFFVKSLFRKNLGFR